MKRFTPNMATPNIDTKTVEEIVTIAKQRAFTVSEGRLNDFSPASPISAILEATAIQASRVLERVNGLAATLENQRVALFGLEKSTGNFAIARIGIRLDGSYGEAFVLPQGFRIAIAGLQYETVEDFAIPAYSNYGEVNIVCLTEGARGNVAASSGVSFGSLRKVASIALTGDATNGRDAESSGEFQQRVFTLLRSRDTLISEADFVRAATDFLGIGSTAIAIGRLKPDRTYANGFVSVFCLNSEGKVLTNAQASALTDEFNSVAAMATVRVESINLFEIRLNVVLGFSATAPDAIAATIFDNLSTYLKPGNLAPGEAIYNKAIEARLQGIEGIIPGIVNVEINGLSQPQPMPNIWSVGVLKKIELVLISNNKATGEFKFEKSY